LWLLCCPQLALLVMLEPPAHPALWAHSLLVGQLVPTWYALHVELAGPLQAHQQPPAQVSFFRHLMPW
jgi:hypothetical protein